MDNGRFVIIHRNHNYEGLSQNKMMVIKITLGLNISENFDSCKNVSAARFQAPLLFVCLFACCLMAHQHYLGH